MRWSVLCGVVLSEKVLEVHDAEACCLYGRRLIVESLNNHHAVSRGTRHWEPVHKQMAELKTGRWPVLACEESHHEIAAGLVS